MFVVFLFLFPVLLYNTEALPAANSEDDYGYPLNTVWDTSIDTNASESFAVENNNSYSVPRSVVDETIIVPTSKSIRVYGVNTTIKPITDDDDEPTNHTETNESYSVTNERQFSRNITTIPNSGYNGTAEVSETTTAKIPHDRYSDRFGPITLENGILTAHLLETGSAEEIPHTTVAATTLKRPSDWWTYKYGTTTTTGRPYYNSYYGSYRQNTTAEDATTPKRPSDWWTYKYGTTSTAVRPYYNPYNGWYRQNTTTEDATTPKRPSDWWTYKYGTTSTAVRPYYNPYNGWYRQNTTTEDATTPKRPSDWWTYKYGTTSTTERPYYSWHDKTAEVFETTTTGKLKDWFNRGLRAYFRNITIPNFWYNKTLEDSETTTTARSYNRYWPWREYYRNTTPTPDSWHEYSTWDTTQERYGTYPRTTTAAPRATSTTDAYEYTWYPTKAIDRYKYTWYTSTTTAAPPATSTTDAYKYTWYPTTTMYPYRYTWDPTTTTDRYTHTWYPTTTLYPYRYTWDPTTTTDRYIYTWYPTATTDRYTYTWYPTTTMYPVICTWDSTRTIDPYRYTWDPTTTTDTYQHNTDKTTDTTDQSNRTPPATTCKSCTPENISNSTINTNDRGNYGKLIDLLKRIAGNILPSTISIAPNSNVTHLTVASGNGNMFINVNN